MPDKYKPVETKAGYGPGRHNGKVESVLWDKLKGGFYVACGSWV